jgi:L-ascorbate metabolism protein UlaG (beta-lactamase superfamily)
MKVRTLSIIGLMGLAILLQTGCASTPATAKPTAAKAEPSPTEKKPAVRIHFLGHAAFILEFDNGTTLLSDYGDASQTGWGMQVFGFGSFQPDIVTYSQTHHMDHFTPMEFENAKIIIGEAELSGEDPAITPVPTHELTMDAFDSCGYLISYKELKLLIAGEPLQYILAAAREDVREEIRSRYADAYDLVILPVSGLTITFPQLEAFIRLLNTKRVILMHAMDLHLYAMFLSFLEDEHPGEYQVYAVDGAVYELDPAQRLSATTVISLSPAPYEGTP